MARRARGAVGGVALLVTASRVYLGAHGLGDVLAGVAAATAGLALAWPPRLIVRAS